MKSPDGVRVTLLSENLARGKNILGEHGLAWWIDTGDARVLFDTGQGLALGHNAAQLGIDLGRADAIVLSHGHYDHVGGLPIALERAPRASLWLHPAACAPKFSRSADGRARRISTDFMEHRDFGRGREIRHVEAPVEVVPGIRLTGEVPRTHPWEDVGGPFFLDEGLSEPDPIRDDLTMFLPGDGECTVIFGCAHAGIINILDYISHLTGGLPFGTLAGGLHLLAAGPERMDHTIGHLRELDPKRILACHCTGFRAQLRIAAGFPDIVAEAHAGMTFGGSERERGQSHNL